MSYDFGLDVLGRGHGSGGGHHGSGGGHHGAGHHGGHGRGFRGGRGWGWGGPGYYYDDYDVPQCLAYDAEGKCVLYNVPAHADILGMFDIGAYQKQMNVLKQVPVSVAQVLLRYGQRVIDSARFVASTKNLPGASAQEKVFWKLQWHADALSKEKDPHAIYAPGKDLEQAVIQSFIEWNAVEVGSGAADKMWSDMWTEIKQAIAALPATVAKKITETSSWLKWVLIGVAGVAVLGAGAAVYSAAKR